MIKILNSYNNYSRKVLKSLVPSYTGMLRVKAGRPLINHFLRIGLLVKGSIETSLVKVIVYFVRYLYNLSKKNGIPFTVKYLKASVSLMMQALSGEKHKDTRALGMAVSRTKFGLPRFIPSVHRKLIRAGSLYHIRLWLTLMSVYRVLEYTGKLSINTIIKPSNFTFDKYEVKRACNNLNFIKKNMILESSFIPTFWIASSSPTSTKRVIHKFKVLQESSYSTSLPAIIVALLAYSNNHDMIRRYVNYAQLANLRGPILFLMQKLIDVDNFTLSHKYGITERLPKLLHFKSCKINYEGCIPNLGKLSFKIEPAGKIRVFAMVDCFTQWLLAPLHEALFKSLRALPSDATFDQTKAVNDFNSKLLKADIKKVYSFDLSAATDRLPVDVQACILSYVTNIDGLGEAWKALLVDRWYTINHPSFDSHSNSARRLGIDLNAIPSHVKIERKLTYDKRNVDFVTAVKYKTGQPMGALSSWAMLALTHHVMVQIAANRAGLPKGTFHLYLVLGDDLVIAHEQVAKEYLKLAKEWDVDINLSKSVLSRNGSFEFAKRFFYKGNDVTGISFKEMSVAYFDIRGLIQLINRISTFRNPRISELLSFLGHGYKALSKINGKFSRMGKGMRKALMLLSYPGMRFSKLDNVSEWISSIKFNKPNRTIWSKSSIDILKFELSGISTSKDFTALPKSVNEVKTQLGQLYGPDLAKKASSGLGMNPAMPYYTRSYENFVSLIAHCVGPMFLTIDEKNRSINFRANSHTNQILNADHLIDSVWAKVEELEDVKSLNSDLTMFRTIKDVVTLGSSTLLKKCDKLRNTLTRFKDQNNTKSKVLQISFNSKF